MSMEIKKSKSADLERRRGVWFLVGLVTTLSLFLCALEIPLSGGDGDIDENALADIVHDMEINADVPMQQTLVRIEPEKKEPVMERLKVVPDETELPQPEEPAEETEEPAEKEIVGDVPELPDDIDPAAATSAIAPAGTNTENFRVVADLPKYPGGAVEFMKWLTRNLKYPQQAQRRKVQGKVVAQFIVDADGSVTNLKIVKSLNPDCDREALRVLRMMPKWQPGMQDGKPCRTMVAIPIVFKL